MSSSAAPAASIRPIKPMNLSKKRNFRPALTFCGRFYYPPPRLESEAQMSAVTLPANYKPTEKEKYMNPQMLEYFRQKLLHWKADIVKESDELLHELQDEGGMQEPDIADRAS